MAATYQTTWRGNLDHARNILGDTDVPANALLQDEEIESALAIYSFNEAVASLAEGLATRFAQRPDEYDEGGSGVSLSWRSRVEAWRKLADRLRKEIASPAAPSQVVAAGQLDKPDLSKLRL